jgi:hypothetical protein
VKEKKVIQNLSYIFILFYLINKLKFDYLILFYTYIDIYFININVHILFIYLSKHTEKHLFCKHKIYFMEVYYFCFTYF